MTTAPASTAAVAPKALPPMTALKDCRHGRLLFLRNDTYVGRSLDLYGEYSEAETAVLCGLLRPKDVVIEAGANIGAMTVAFAKAVGPRGRVFAFEPQRRIFQILCANLAINEIGNVHAVQAALGRAKGTLRVPPLSYRKVFNFGGVAVGSKTGETVSVAAIDALGFDRLSLVKADVEGMELDVIKGGARTIARLRPILYLENDRHARSSELIRLVMDLGYRLWWHLPLLYNPRNRFSNPKNVFGRAVSVNMLCIPKERNIDIKGSKEVTSPDDNWRALLPKAPPKQ